MYEHFASHMFPEVCWWGVMVKRLEQTSQALCVVIAAAHGRDARPLNRTRRSRALRGDSWNEPLSWR